MTTFAERCGLPPDAAREAAVSALLQRVRDERLHAVRLTWCDLHGALRSKTLEPEALAGVLREGVGLVGTLMLKDTADRTALPVFDPSSVDSLPVGAQAGNLRLLPDPDSLQPLPWAPGVAWLRGDPFTEAGQPVALDPRHALRRLLARLGRRGLKLVCGLEVEFHVYRIVGAPGPGRDTPAHEDPAASAWPPPAPTVSLTHPGYRLLGDDLADAMEPVFSRIRAVARGLGLGLQSLEIELGPSQVEAVFAPCDALQAADRMVAFRHGVRQALAREGLLATFMCQPPFGGAVASGWHLHQSLCGTPSALPAPAADAQALARLGPTAAAWLAGLLAHARGMAAFAAPTVSGYARFQGGPMSPLQAVWGLDSRGAMLRVIGGAGGTPEQPGDAHIENRLGEPAANPYLYIASQVAAGLDGLERGLAAPPACRDPYALGSPREGLQALPRSLDQALAALDEDPLWSEAVGADLLAVFLAAKRAECARHHAAEDRGEWLRREYFGRF